MKFRLRTLLMVVALIAVPIAAASYINNSVIPTNRRTALELVQQLGKQFETTGTYVNADTIEFDKLELSSTSELQATSRGTTANQWGQEINVIPALFLSADGRTTLDLTAISRGPFGVIGVCSVTETFEHEVGDINRRPVFH